MKNVFLGYAGLLAAAFSSLASANPIAIVKCTGAQHIVEGGLSEHSEYNVPGAELKLFKTSSGKYRAALISPIEGLKNVSGLERNVVQVGGTVGGYEAIFIEDSTGRDFQFYTSSESATQTRFHANTLAQLAKAGWSEFSFTCVGDLSE